MKRMRRGFTLIEVSLFLAITAAIFVGVAVGTQNSIFQQRYNDSVQNFAEFLRGIYSQVTNVQSEGTGRGDYAIYGKLVIFGEDKDSGDNKITTYNVIGKIDEDGIGSGDILGQLERLDVNVVVKDGENGYKPVGFVESYKPRWASQIQTGKGWDATPAGRYDVYTGALLIVRHPSSGTVYTFSMKSNPGVEGGPINVDGYIDTLNGGGTAENPLQKALDKFEVKNVDFCVNPNGADRSTLRRGVRILAGARNASGIEILPDGEGCDP